MNFQHKFAVVSDLHEQNPDEVLAMLRKISPDLILVPGDMMERLTDDFRKAFTSPSGGNLTKGWRSKLKHFAVWWIFRADDVFEYLRKRITGLEPVSYVPENTYRFFREANKIAPVIYARGNHEMYLTELDRKILVETSSILLENEDISIILQANTDKTSGALSTYDTIRIGGMTTEPDLVWLREYAAKDGYKILLCHQPEWYMKHIYGTDLDVFDLVLAGHAHGGQWKIFGKPIYAPDQGLFPKYVSGEHGKMIISTGVSNTSNLPRIGNPCEVVVVMYRKM